MRSLWSLVFVSLVGCGSTDRDLSSIQRHSVLSKTSFYVPLPSPLNMYRLRVDYGPDAAKVVRMQEAEFGSSVGFAGFACDIRIEDLKETYPCDLRNDFLAAKRLRKAFARVDGSRRVTFTVSRIVRVRAHACRKKDGRWRSC